MLNHKEWMRINSILLLMYSTEDFDTMRTYILDSIKVLIPYKKAMFYMVIDDGNSIQLDCPIFVNVDKKFAIEYEKTVEFGYLGRVALSARRSLAYKDTDLMTEDIRINSDVYKSFLKPYDVPYGAGIILAENNKLVGELTLFRSKLQGDFSERDVCILDILREHLEIRLQLSTEVKYDTSYIKHLQLLKIGLTQREIEILELIINDYSTDDISTKLNISIHTTKKHLSNIYSKLDISNRLQLVNYFNSL